MSAASDARAMVAALVAENRRLRAELEAVKAQSSAGFSRGAVRQAPIRDWAWTQTHTTEDLL